MRFPGNTRAEDRIAVRSVAQTALVCFLLASSNIAHAQLSTPVITTLPGGRVQVKNAGPSKWTGTNGWKFVLERTIQPADGSPGMLERPAQIAVAKDGQMLVYDGGRGELLQFAADGQFLRKIGSKGQGPGEYEFLLGFDTRDGVIVGYEPNLRRLITWKSDGSYVRQFATPSSNCGSGPTLLEAGGTVVIPACINKGESFRGAMVRFSLTGQVKDTMLLPLTNRTAPGWKAGSGLYTIPFSPGVEYAYDSQSRYIHGWSGTYSLFVANHLTDTARVIQLPGSAQPVPSRFLDSVYERSQRGVLKGIAKRSDYPAFFPLFTALRTDELDNIWIIRPGPDSRPALLDVVDRDGRFLGSVAFPPGITRAPVWRNGRMYRASEDADGLPVVQVFRIDRGKY